MGTESQELPAGGATKGPAPLMERVKCVVLAAERTRTCLALAVERVVRGLAGTPKGVTDNAKRWG